MNTAFAGAKVPSKFLPEGRSTPVLPPREESTMARRVVGTWM